MIDDFCRIVRPQLFQHHRANVVKVVGPAEIFIGPVRDAACQSHRGHEYQGRQQEHSLDAKRGFEVASKLKGGALKTMPYDKSKKESTTQIQEIQMSGHQPTVTAAHSCHCK